MAKAKQSEESHESKTTTDHEEIRRWVEERDGHPARVEGTNLLRIDTSKSGLDHLSRRVIARTDMSAELRDIADVHVIVSREFVVDAGDPAEHKAGEWGAEPRRDSAPRVRISCSVRS